MTAQDNFAREPTQERGRELVDAEVRMRAGGTRPRAALASHCCIRLADIYDEVERAPPTSEA
jgi:hypothetical protein